MNLIAQGFSFASLFKSVAFAAFMGGVLGFLVSLLVELVVGKRLSAKAKRIIVFIGVIVGYSTVKVLLQGK